MRTTRASRLVSATRTAANDNATSQPVTKNSKHELGTTAPKSTPRKMKPKATETTAKVESSTHKGPDRRTRSSPKESSSEKPTDRNNIEKYDEETGLVRRGQETSSEEAEGTIEDQPPTLVTKGPRGLPSITKIDLRKGRGEIKCSCDNMKIQTVLCLLEASIDNKTKAYLHNFLTLAELPFKQTDVDANDICSDHLHMLTDFLNLNWCKGGKKNIIHNVVLPRINELKKERLPSKQMPLVSKEVATKYGAEASKGTLSTPLWDQPQDQPPRLHAPSTPIWRGLLNNEQRSEWKNYGTVLLPDAYAWINSSEILKEMMQKERDLILHHHAREQGGHHYVAATHSSAQQFFQHDPELLRHVVLTELDGPITYLAMPMPPLVITGERPQTWSGSDFEALAATGVGANAIDAYIIASHPCDPALVMNFETYSVNLGITSIANHLRDRFANTAHDLRGGFEMTPDKMSNNPGWKNVSLCASMTNAVLYETDEPDLPTARATGLGIRGLFLTRATNLVKFSARQQSDGTKPLIREPVLIYRTRFLPTYEHDKVDSLLRESERCPETENYDWYECRQLEKVSDLRKEWDGTNYDRPVSSSERIWEPMLATQPISRMLVGNLSYRAATVLPALRKLLSTDAATFAATYKQYRAPLGRAYARAFSESCLSEVAKFQGLSMFLGNMLGLPHHFMLEVVRKAPAGEFKGKPRDTISKYDADLYSEEPGVTIVRITTLQERCPKSLTFLLPWKETYTARTTAAQKKDGKKAQKTDGGVEERRVVEFQERMEKMRARLRKEREPDA